MSHTRATAKASIAALFLGMMGCGPSLANNPAASAPPTPGPAALLIAWYYDLPEHCFEEAQRGGDAGACLYNAIHEGGTGQPWRAGELLVPLGCFLPESGLVEASECPEPLGDAPASLDDTAVTLGFPLTFECPADGSDARGYVAEFEKGHGHTVAIWPEPWSERLFEIEPGDALEPQTRGYIEARVYSELGPTAGPLEIEQIVNLDVDGDGDEEPIVSVFVASSDDMTTYRYSALVLVDDGEVRELRRSEWELFQLVGASDLDGDGQLELVTFESYYEGSAYIFWTLDGRILGEVGCGA